MAAGGAEAGAAGSCAGGGSETSTTGCAAFFDARAVFGPLLPAFFGLWPEAGSAPFCCCPAGGLAPRVVGGFVPFISVAACFGCFRPEAGDVAAAEPFRAETGDIGAAAEPFRAETGDIGAAVADALRPEAGDGAAVADALRPEAGDGAAVADALRPEAVGAVCAFFLPSFGGSGGGMPHTHARTDTHTHD